MRRPLQTKDELVKRLDGTRVDGWEITYEYPGDIHLTNPACGDLTLIATPSFDDDDDETELAMYFERAVSGGHPDWEKLDYPGGHFFVDDAMIDEAVYRDAVSRYLQHNRHDLERECPGYGRLLAPTPPRRHVWGVPRRDNPRDEVVGAGMEAGQWSAENFLEGGTMGTVADVRVQFEKDAAELGSRADEESWRAWSRAFYEARAWALREELGERTVDDLGRDRLETEVVKTDLLAGASPLPNALAQLKRGLT